MNITHPNKVENFRMKHVLSKAELSRLAKVSIGVIYKMENKPHMRTRIEMKMRVAKALGLDPLEVFPNDPELKIKFGDEYESP